MRLESKPAADMLLYVVIIAAGLLLMYLARGFSHGGTNVLCGFLLGCLLAVVGIMALVVGESRSIELDERRRRIVLDVRRRVGGGRQIIIPFGDITGFGIGVQGKASAGSRFYDVVVRLNSGREIHLFGGCVFEGRMSRERVEGLRQTFEQAVMKS